MRTRSTRPHSNRYTVQIIEVTPAKEIVWALRSWDAPNDLGPSTLIQLLGEPVEVMPYP